MPLDLFGAEIREPVKNMVKGYPTFPGTGPAGETCRSCKHKVAHQYNRTYWKCWLVKPTRGPGTDIRLKSPACAYWASGRR